MKNLLLTALIGTALAITNARAVDYYYDGSGALNATTSWFTNRDGTGSNPTNFTTAGNMFVIQASQSPTLGGAWTISGSGSGLLIETGGSMTPGANNPNLTLSMQSGATYIMNNSAYAGLDFGTIDTNSQFTIGGSATNFRDTLTYGNATWNSSGNTTPGNVVTTGNFTIASSELRGSTGTTSRTWTVGGDLNIGASGTLRLNNSTTANTVINIAGGLDNDGTINKGSGTSTASINFTGTGSSSASWGTHSGGPFGVSVASTKTITFTDSLNTGGGNLSVAGTLLVSSGTTVATGAGTTTVSGTLRGEGTFSGAVAFSAGSTHSPGNSPGLQTFSGGLSYTDATVLWELTSDTAAGRGLNFDGIDVTGGSFLVSGTEINLTLNGSGSTVDFTNSAFWGVNQSWTIYDSSVTRTGTFTLGTISLDSLGNAYTPYGTFGLDQSGNDVVLTWSAVPEPTASVLAGVGLAMVLWRAKRRRSA